MALSDQDLKNIESIVGRSEVKLGKRIEQVEIEVVQKMERMEKRLVASIDALQAHDTARLDAHERRIERLERLQGL